MKQIVLTKSEIDRSQLMSDGTHLTIASRRQSDKTYKVMVVRIETKEIIQEQVCKLKSEIPKAITSVCRWIDKLGYCANSGPGMFDNSRHRNKNVK